MINALNDLTDNICIKFGNTLYLHVVDISMGNNGAPLICGLFLYFYESHFMAKLFKNPSKHCLLHTFDNSFRYLHDILSVNSPNLFKLLPKRT